MSSIMKAMAHDFFAIFLATILITRIYLYYRPTSSPTLFGLRLHHYMYGLVLTVFGLLIDSLFVYAVGLALFVDELAFLLLRGTSHEDNYSWKSLLGTALFIALVFILRDYLVLPLN